MDKLWLGYLLGSLGRQPRPSRPVRHIDWQPAASVLGAALNAARLILTRPRRGL